MTLLVAEDALDITVRRPCRHGRWVFSRTALLMCRGIVSGDVFLAPGVERVGTAASELRGNSRGGTALDRHHFFASRLLHSPSKQRRDHLRLHAHRGRMLSKLAEAQEPRPLNMDSLHVDIASQRMLQMDGNRPKLQGSAELLIERMVPALGGDCAPFRLGLIPQVVDVLSTHLSVESTECCF